MVDWNRGDILPATMICVITFAILTVIVLGVILSDLALLVVGIVFSPMMIMVIRDLRILFKSEDRDEKNKKEMAW